METLKKHSSWYSEGAGQMLGLMVSAIDAGWLEPDSRQAMFTVMPVQRYKDQGSWVSLTVARIVLPNKVKHSLVWLWII